MMSSLNLMGPRARVTLGLIALAALGALAACGSVPTTSYYTLTPPPSQAQFQFQSQSQSQSQPGVPAASSSVATPPQWIEVQAVGLSESLDQPQMVMRKSDSAVVVLEQERWSAPLSQELRDALSAHLSRQLGVQDVAGLTVPAGRDVLRIKVQMRRFEAWPGQQVHLAADWAVMQSTDPTRRINCRSELSQPAGASVAEVVQAQQRLLASFAQTMAATLKQWPQAACPGA